MAVCMRHQLIGFFSRSVQRYRMIDIVMNWKRHLGVCPVYRTGWSEYQVLHTGMSAALEHIDKSDQIRVHVCMRIFKGISDTGLGRKIDDNIEMIVVKKLIQAVAIGQVHFRKGEIGVWQNIFQTGLFEPHIIVRIQIVDTRNPNTIV